MENILNLMRVLLSIIYISAATCISAQSEINNLGHAPSPQAADLGHFGNIPVSYYTGRANVSIPICSFDDRGVSFDINLTYDTSGLLMNKLPGWVGPGWTLNAGGCITRVQNNFCDEMVFDSHFPFSDYHNYFQSHYLMVNNGDLDSIYVCDLSKYSKHDFSPDIFYFSFMGKSGRFFLGNDGEWKVCSDENLVVEFDYNNPNNYITPVFSTYPADFQYIQPKSIKGFTMYDDNGTKFVFGCDTAAIEYSIDLFRTTDREDYVPWTATSWFLTKVIDRFGNLLYNLEYVRGKFIAQLYRTNSLLSFYITGSHKAYDEFLFSSDFSGTLNLPVYLSKITTRSGDILTFNMRDAYQTGTAARHLYPSLYENNTNSGTHLFSTHANYNQYQFYYLQSPIDSIAYRRVPCINPNSDPLSGIDMQVLDHITMKHSLADEVQTYNFEYDSIGRLHLSKLIIIANNRQIQRYSFLYNNYHSVPQDYLTDQHDHWGYLNQKYVNDSILTPNLDEEYITEGEGSGGNDSGTQIINREPTLEYALHGMLTEIVYPTGGCTQFEYELHDYSSILSADRQSMETETGVAGGLRIKKITDIAGESYNIIRTFSYKGIQGISSGQLFARPTYFWHWEADNADISFAQSVPVIPLSTSTGTHIGYSTVTETMSDGTSHQYHYTNFSDVKDEFPLATSLPSLSGHTGFATPFDRFGDLSFKRGRLISEIVRDSDDCVLNRTTYVYRQDENDFMNDFSYASNINIFTSPSGSGVIYDVGNIFKLYYPKYDLIRTVTSTNHNGVMVTDTCTYSMQTFNDYINGWPIKPFFRKCAQEDRSRTNNHWTTSYEYVTDANTPCYLPIQRTKEYYNGSLTVEKSTLYSLIDNNFQPHYETICKGGVTDTLITYNSFLSTGLPLSYVKKGEFPTYLFWDMQDHLLASVTSPYQSLVYTDSIPQNMISPLEVVKYQGQSIFKYPEVKASTYIYDRRGLLVASATDNGIVNYYLYDSLNRLTEIQDANHKAIRRFKYHYRTTLPQFNPPVSTI